MAEPESQRAPARLLDHYGLLLVVLLVVLVLLGIPHTSRTTVGFQGLLIGVVAVLTVRASGMSGRWISWTIGGSVLLAIAVAAEAVAHDSTTPAASFALMTLALLLLPVVVMRRIFFHAIREVTGQTILAALCVYLLIALIFVYALLFINAAAAGSAIHPASNNPPDYLYLSITTLTTVGFGDVIAAQSVARLLTELEAVIGQVFLVILVARLVTAWRPRRLEEDAD